MIKRILLILVVGSGLAGVVLWIMTDLTFRGAEYFAPLPSFRDVPQDPAMLVAGLYSYETVAKARRTLSARGYEMTILRDEQWSGVGIPISHVVAIVERFVDHGHSGTLTLSFLNDRLGTAIFEPGDWRAYSSDLSREGIPSVEGLADRIEVRPHVVLRPFHGEGSRRGIAYSDTRLDREIDIYMAKTDD